MGNKKHIARKRFGQHFLHDQSVVADIITAAEISSTDDVIEIGPGKGVLTELMLEQANSVTAIEIDRDLSKALRAMFSLNPKFRLIEDDILKTDWESFLQDRKTPKLVANLPYNISTPLFFKLAKFRHHFDSVVIMVQKELARRLCHTGEPDLGLKDYGVLSVVAMTAFQAEKIRDVPPACFTPPPKVDSSVIRLVPKGKDLPDEDVFFRFVQRMFGARRKLILTRIRKNEPELYETLSAETRQKLTNLRPENLKPRDFVHLFLAKDL